MPAFTVWGRSRVCVTGRADARPSPEARRPMPLTFHIGNRGTDKNAPPLSCGWDAHAPFYCCPQRSAGILPAGAGTAPPPYWPGSADVLVGKKYGAGDQGRRGRRRSQGISQSPATRCSRKEDEKGCEKLVTLGETPQPLCASHALRKGCDWKLRKARWQSRLGSVPTGTRLRKSTA